MAPAARQAASKESAAANTSDRSSVSTMASGCSVVLLGCQYIVDLTEQHAAPARSLASTRAPRPGQPERNGALVCANLAAHQTHFLKFIDQPDHRGVRQPEGATQGAVGTALIEADDAERRRSDTGLIRLLSALALETRDYLLGERTQQILRF